VTSSPDPVPTTIAVYNRSARTFADASRDRTHMGDLHKKFASLCPGPRVLDLCAGPGHDTAALADLGFEVVACEPSDALLAAGREHPALAGRLVCADGRQLPFSETVFDGVWACASLLHLPKEQAPLALAESRRILRAGGLLFTSMQEGHRAGLIESGSEDSLSGRFYAFYRAHEWLQIVEDAGYEVMEQRLKRTTDHVTLGAIGWIETYARKPATSSSR
jgi:ubiquinone/menaquinone biosynthesis C-methylase UbiE